VCYVQALVEFCRIAMQLAAAARQREWHLFAKDTACIDELEVDQLFRHLIPFKGSWVVLVDCCCFYMHR